MGRVLVRAFGVSVDGFGAGPDQSLENPLGVGGKQLHGWAFQTRTFRTMFGQDGGSTGVDDAYAARSFENLGAWILGRNMFGPVRGAWPDDSWKGWWGTNPPYHVPVFVLTHHARPSIEMEGGTVFHFVTDGIRAALERAKAAAGDKDIRIGGGPATIRQYLQAGLIDEMHLAVAPTLLGSGEPFFDALDLVKLGFTVAEQTPTELALHVVLRRA
jgi:dihydrofolate reductase